MLRTCMTAAFAAFMALPAAALDLDTMSDADRAAFGDAVREYLLENPQVIMDAVAVLEERQQAEQARADFDLVSDNKESLFDDGFSFVAGNPDGDITLVEFMDYRCGFCKRAVPEVDKLLASDGNIRLIVKEFPILGDQSVLASRFAIATKHVIGTEAYKVMHETLIAYNGEINMPALTRIANGLGFDAAAIEAAMASDDVSHEIAATRALAQRLQISGTPTFVMHDELLRGFLPYDQLRLIVDEKRG
ncbi:MAG: DsbA family protein [Aliishimia sp.]